MTQLVLPLPVRTALGRDDYFIAPCNALAVAMLDGWTAWQNCKLALVGPQGSGKTHLAHVWAAQSGAVIVDAAKADMDLINAPAVVVEGMDKLAGNAPAQEALFHLHNALNSAKKPLLVTGKTAPSNWDIELPDLKSRLCAIHLATLEPPDDALLSMLLVKLFNDRQLDVAPNLISYLIKRIGRSHAAALQVVDQLDSASLARKKPVTMRFAAQILDGGPA